MRNPEPTAPEPVPIVSPKKLVPVREATPKHRPAKPACERRSVPTCGSGSGGVTGKGLLISVAVLLAMLFAYNLALWRGAKHSQRHQLLARLDHLPADTGLIFLGNSLVEAGCNVEVFSHAWSNQEKPLKAVNIALGATSPVEHYLILKRALEKQVRPRFIVYGFFDDQLNAPVPGDWSDLVGNRAFSTFFPADAAELYEPGSLLKRWQLWLTGHIPMLAERSSAWGKVDNLRRAIEQIGMPRQQMNRFGRVVDFSVLEAKDVPDFNKRCAEALRSGGSFSAPVEKMIRLAQSHGAQFVLLEMPMPSHHRRLFYSSPRWNELRTAVERKAAAERVLFISASDWVQQDSAFEDATHLGEEGAKFFSSRLAAILERLEPGKAKVGSGK